MTTSRKIKVFVVDDHIVVKDAVAELIAKFNRCEIEGTASNGKELITALEKGSSPEIILLDVNMPEMDGFETASWLAAHRPEIKIIIFSMLDGDLLLLHFLKMGINGFLEKNISKRELEKAINEVADNRNYYSSSTASKIASLFFRNSDSSEAVFKLALTEKELSLLRLLVEDITYKEIADRLSISLRSVESQKEQLCKKIGVPTRVGLITYALQKGLASAERFAVRTA